RPVWIAHCAQSCVAYLRIPPKGGCCEVSHTGEVRHTGEPAATRRTENCVTGPQGRERRRRYPCPTEQPFPLRVHRPTGAPSPTGEPRPADGVPAPITRCS